MNVPDRRDVLWLRQQPVRCVAESVVHRLHRHAHQEDGREHAGGVDSLAAAARSGFTQRFALSVSHAPCGLDRWRAKGPQTSQPRATPWVMGGKESSPERARQRVPPFQGWFVFFRYSQGVALGWLVSAPLVLPPTQRAKCMAGTRSLLKYLPQSLSHRARAHARNRIPLKRRFRARARARLRSRPQVFQQAAKPLLGETIRLHASRSLLFISPRESFRKLILWRAWVLLFR